MTSISQSWEQVAEPPRRSIKYRRLGQRFLRAVRAQTPNFDDPLLNDYLEHQIYRLASYSDLEDFRLYIVMINNPTINAFAAPGGILGIHHGLFLTATSVHEFSAILAHELAHLSQRHFARGLEDSRKAGVISIAGLLAGAIIAAYGGGERHRSNDYKPRAHAGTALAIVAPRV